MTKVAAVVGHGVKPDGTYDPGAVGDGTNEQIAGDIVTHAFATELEAYGVHVPVNEAHSDDPNYVGSVNHANDADVDYAISFHHDWSGAPDGFFCHWWDGSEKGEALADAFYGAVLSRSNYPVRPDWHKARNLYFLRKTAMPAVLVELGRIGQYNNEELEYLGLFLAHVFLEHLSIDTTPQYDKDVAVIWNDEKDQALAIQLGYEHTFWFDHVPNPSKSIRYAILVGKAAHYAGHFPESTRVWGKTLTGTALAVKKLLKEKVKDREAPFPDGRYVDR